jgi:hypothetical protein
MAQLAYWFEDYKQFDAKPAEIKALFSNTLDVTRLQRNYSTKCCGAEGEVVDPGHFRILYPVFSIRNVHHDAARKHASRIARLR